MHHLFTWTTSIVPKYMSFKTSYLVQNVNYFICSKRHILRTGRVYPIVIKKDPNICDMCAEE